jgi:peptide/nickel transport system permease protein
MAIFIFAVSLQWLPLGGTGLLEGATGWKQWRFLLLPALVLAVQHVGQWLRLERAYSLALLNEGWHLTGRAKGMTHEWLFRKRQFKLTMGRLSTVWALDLPVLLGGALITETVFNWPGVARLLYESVLGKDSDMAMACLVFLGVLTLLANQLADHAVGWFDPRARGGKQ